MSGKNIIGCVVSLVVYEAILVTDFFCGAHRNANDADPGRATHFFLDFISEQPYI
jgi:hypothetical protein